MSRFKPPTVAITNELLRINDHLFNPPSTVFHIADFFLSRRMELMPNPLDNGNCNLLQGAVILAIEQVEIDGYHEGDGCESAEHR
jgi:hypothetical protein